MALCVLHTKVARHIQLVRADHNLCVPTTKCDYHIQLVRADHNLCVPTNFRPTYSLQNLWDTNDPGSVSTGCPQNGP